MTNEAQTIWQDNEGDTITLTIKADGSAYGIGNSFDFERDSEAEAIYSLEEWGYRRVGVE